jgi:hypothetical protein
MDLRFTRTFRSGASRLQANIDLYNVLNAELRRTPQRQLRHERRHVAAAGRQSSPARIG